MDPSRDFRLYLSRRLRAEVAAGDHAFLGQVTRVLERHGYRVLPSANDRAAKAAAPDLPGWAMFHMEHPTHDRALVFRKAYHGPFWAIERQAQRWRWPVAQARFPLHRIDPETAARFYARWQRRLFGQAPQAARRDGFVYIPLQGRLLEHRNFQDCAPIEMLERVLEGEPKRPLLATLHPKERYSEAERAALDSLTQRFPRLQLTTRPMADLLAHCDYVVTENSSAAFFGFFFGKPAITFARIDFHHICLGADGFDRIADHAPAFDRYIWWFWQRQSINAGRPDAERQIADRLRRCGVPLDDPATDTGPDPTPQ
ncbi:hypothetical protein [Pseudooceanicola sp. 200-1SW]|uniref:hypothetical protein n=1 Tax=Pseudooceanicola sp. 200-1SW TaxID=3425949 RepID=UPI003D7FDAE2